MQVYGLIGYLWKYPERWIKIDSSEPGGIPGEWARDTNNMLL
jgi:hypothetical protein